MNLKYHGFVRPCPRCRSRGNLYIVQQEARDYPNTFVMCHSPGCVAMVGPIDTTMGGAMMGWNRYVVEAMEFAAS